MRIGICDVCQEDIERLKNQLEQKMDQTGRKGCIFEFGSADEVLKFLKESQLDLLFWNIEKGQTVPEEAASPGRMPERTVSGIYRRGTGECFRSVPHPAFLLLLKKPDRRLLRRHFGKGGTRRKRK